jgi:hypothetical protein
MQEVLPPSPWYFEGLNKIIDIYACRDLLLDKIGKIKPIKLRGDGYIESKQRGS